MKITEFSQKQAEILKFAYSDEDTIICDGAVRSGKTVAMILAFVLWAMEGFDRTNFAICGKTVSNAERNILRPFQQIEGMPFTMSYKISTRMLTVKCGKKENYFYLFGGKDESSYALIQGLTLAGVLLDEVALMPQSFVDQAIARTLSYKRAKIWFNCNPEGPSHWFYKEWIANKKRKFKHLHFLMRDNPILGDEEIRRAEKLFDGVFYDRYILGKWVAAQGAIYRQFADEPSRFITDDDKDAAFAVIGVDFGGNMSAHAFVCVGFSRDMKRITVLDEYYKKKMITPKDLEDDFLAFVIRNKERYPIYEARCDSAETTLIRGLTAAVIEAGVSIDVKKAIKGQINERIRFTNMMLSLGRFKIMRRCVHLREALCEAVWDDKSIVDKRLDDGKLNVDSLDAMEYAFEPFMRDMTEISRMGMVK